MSKNKPKIRSLKALEAEKARLRASMEASQTQLFAAYKDARKKAPAYALKKIAPPAILAGISAFVFRKQKNEEMTYSEEAPASRRKAGFGAVIFSMLMALLDNWIDRKF